MLSFLGTSAGHKEEDVPDQKWQWRERHWIQSWAFTATFPLIHLIDSVCIGEEVYQSLSHSFLLKYLSLTSTFSCTWFLVKLLAYPPPLSFLHSSPSSSIPVFSHHCSHMGHRVSTNTTGVGLLDRVSGLETQLCFQSVDPEASP